MDDYKKQIDEILQSALVEKSFSLEIVERIKKLKDGFNEQAILIESYKNRELERDKEIFELRERHITAVQTVDAFKNREASLEEREKIADKNEYELNFQKQRANEIKEILGIVFKNTVVRQNIHKNSNDGRGGYANESISIDKQLE